MVLIGLALTVWACFVGFLAGYIFNVYMEHGTPGSFLDTYSAFVIPGDLVLWFVKSVIFGAVVAVVASHEGLNTRGGPAGVANSVNAAVVESIVVLMIVNVVLAQLYILIFPRATV